MTNRGLLVLASLAAFCVGAALPASAADPLYVLENAATLSSTDTDWDYVAFDPASNHLFVARRADGLTVFDVNAHQATGTVENSTGANGPTLVPEFNRGYVAMTDGTVLVFDLKTLKAIERFRLDQGGLNRGFYEPTTRRLHMVVGARPQVTTWYTLDAATGKLLGKTEFQSRKMDDPAVDGHGLIFAPERDNNVVLKVNAADLKVQDTWKLGDCVMPSAVEYDDAAHRLFVGCRGDRPVLVVLDVGNGKIVAQLPIGRGIDGMVFDEGSHTIVTSNGVDANLSVIRQEGPDSYRALGVVGTRPMARTMATDPKTKRLFLVTAGFTLPAAGPGGKAPPPIFHDNSFTVLTYAPR